MADINLNGINENCITLKAKEGSDISVGDFVCITATGEVGVPTTKGDIVGMCKNIRNGFVTVQTAGYMTAYLSSGESIAFGYNALGVDTSNKLVAVEGARKILVVEYDSTSRKVGFIL